MDETLKYNFYKNKENIIIEKNFLKYTEHDISYFEKSILNFNNKQKLLNLYKNIKTTTTSKNYELFSNEKIITFVIFNNNNSDILLLNLLNLNNFEYHNFEILIIDNSNELLKPNFISNIIFKFSINIIYGKNFNENIFKSNGDIIILCKSNTYFIKNILDYIIENFKYNDFYNYNSIDLINIKDNDEILEENYNTKHAINNTNLNCLVISKNYFKIINGLNMNYNIKFDFIFYDFYNKINNILKLNLVNINNNIINLYVVNNYNTIGEYNGNDTIELANKCLYDINNSLYKNIKNKCTIIQKKIKYFNKILERIEDENIYKKYIKYINKYVNNYNIEKVNKIENKKVIENNFNKNIVFFDIKNTTSNFNYYMTNMKKYYNILKTKYKTSYREISLDYTNNFNKIKICEYINFNSDDIFIIDDLTLIILITSHFNIKNIRPEIEYFIKNAKYIICFSEIFVSKELQFTGCTIDNKDFTKMVFKNSITNLILNTKNIYYLYENSINNHVYYPSYGYSVVNNICFDLSYENSFKNKEIDLLFYGNYIDSNRKITSKYRYDAINNIKRYCDMHKLNFKSFSNLYEDKNEILKKTKIVIHIAPNKNFHVFSWAKAVELMSKKIFFIVEENEELYLQNLENIVPYYKKNDLNDLYDKINYYLKNENICKKHIEICHNYIKKNYNMDKFLVELIGTI